MPTLEDILKLTKDKGSINIVPLSKGQALTQEEIQAMNNGINNYLPPMSNPDALIKDPKTNTTIDTSNIQSKTLYDALHAPNATPSIESIVQSKKTIDFNPDVKDEEDISDQLARYDFPLYAETDDLNEARAYNAQSNTEAMIKGAKNIIPVAIGVGAQMLGGTMQIANNMLGDDDFDNPITKWGRDYMKNNMNIIYQNPNGNATSNAKSLIAAGSDILGQFGSAIGSMIAISPANAALIKSSVGLGSAVGGPMGGILGGIAGSIAAAAMNAYAEGVIDAADVYDKKYKELWNKTHNMNETQKVAKLAAQTVANQNMILNTALNIIPVMWSVKPYGLDKSIKNALGLPEVESKWFRLQKPYAPNKLATETFDEYADRIAKIKASGFANNEQYSLLSNPFDTLKNIGTYGKQTANSLKYNALHPIEYLNRNWDIIGETVGEGLEEYHNYFAREQGLAVNKEEDAAMIPSMSKLMKGYSDMITKGEGAYDLIAGSIIGGMSAPIMSGFHFGRTKVYNPDNGQMEYKYKRNPALDWIPFELASDHDQKDYENVITNSLQRINDVKSLGQSYLNAQTIEEKDKVVNQLLLAPLTKYVDDGSFETFMLSLEAMKENLGSLAGSEDQIGNYLSVMDKLRYDAAMSNLENETDPKKIASLNTEISVYKDKARKAMSDHSSMLTKRIDFLKSTAEDYRKLKDDISANYGNEDYGYANALFKNKMAFEIEQDMLKKHHQNLENVRTQFKNKIQSQNPSISEGEVYQIMDNAIKNDKDPIYKTDVENYINAKKALLESEFRMERFAQRYLSLATWGYKNEADLRRELELIEEISAFSMTDDEIRSIRDNDNDQNILMLSNFIGMLEMQLQAETDPAKKKQIQDQLNMFKQLMGNFDSNTNDALKKYLRFKSIQQELRDLMKNQVTYELDFKNNEYNYKGFTPLQKYLARNKMMADEFKKMSKAKNDIDILNTEVISVYKQYADRYSDAFTEEQKSLQAITQEFEKLRYNGVIDMTQMNDVNQWLQNHDLIYKEVRDRLLATAHKYSQPGFENPFIANYIKNIIIQMNYQKDVIDQLRQLQFQYELQLTIATSDEIIDLLNKGIITHQQAINYVNESKSITDDEKNTLKEIIAKAEEGIIHKITIRAEGYVPIAYYNNNDEILINDGQEIIYESKNDGTISKTRKNTYSGLDTVTDKDISHYTRFDPETSIDESRLKTDIKYLSTMLRFRESLSPKDSDTLIKFINTKEFIDFIVDNIVKKDINISKTIKVILANIADIDRTSGSDDRKIIYTHAQQELLRVYLYKGDNDLEKIILLGSKNDNSSIENIDKVKFMTLFNSPTTNILSQLKSIDGYQYYHVIDIIKNKSLYKVIDGKLLYFAHPLAYQYLDNPEDMKKIGDFLKDVTTDNIENKITQLNSQISSNFKIIVINPDTNTNDIYTINSEGKLNKETTAELANKGFFDKDLYDATKPKIPSKSLKEQVLDIIKNNKVDSANINTIADDLDNITDINEVNRYIKSDSRADNYPQYLWLLYKLSDPTYFNPHLYVQLKMHHEKINDNFKQTDIYNKIKIIYEDTITSHDTEVLVHDEQGIIYTIDSVSKIIEDNSILQQPTTTNQLNALPTAGFETFNKPISTKKEISKYVPGALLKASEIFWDKNIQTTGSWIPSIQDIDGKTTETYIDIAYDSLSDENKKIAEVLGKIGEFGGIKHIHIVISNRNLSLEEIQKKSIEIANKFKSQPLLWYKPTTLQDAINSLEERRTKNPTIAEQINEEIQKIKDTWGTNLSPGEYFDNDTQTIWDSEELYKKSKGLSTSTDAKAGLERLSNKKLSSSQGEINTGKLEEAVLPNEVVEKSIAQDIDGNWIEVYINNPKLQGVLLARNGNYLFRAMQGRFFVIAKVGNFYLPFYISSAGTSGKNEGEWYPFFGYNDWLVKGRVGKKGEMEYSEKISQVQKLLNDNFRIPAKFFTQFGQIINGKGTPVNPDKVFYDISEHVKYESWFVDFDRQEDNKYTEEQFVADRTGLNPKNVVNDGKGSADSWIRDVVALTEDANTASKGIISNIQPTVSTDAKADIKRTPAIGDTLTSETDKNYRITGFTDKGNIQWINTIDGSRGVWGKDVFRKYIKEGRLRYDLKLESKKETELLQDGKFYTDVKTTDEKVKSDTDIIKDIRAYYYDIVKKSPLKGSEKGRKAVLELIKNLPDIQMLKEFITQLYVNIREADYTPAKDSPFNNDIEEITGKATKDKLTDLKSGEDIIVVNQGGWHYRQIVGVKKDPTKYRFSLNVWGNKELIKILDNIARKYGIYYKTPNSSDRWNDRHDPVTIYVSNSSLTDAQIDALKREIVEETKPYIRSNDGFGIYGENLSKGVEFGLESTQEEVNRILTEADSVNPTLGQAIRTYLEKRTDGQYKSSVGQNLAIIKAINLFKSISQPTETILPPKIYYTNKGALYSINQQGVIEEVKGYNVSKLTGSPITDESHNKLLIALRNKKLSQPFKLKQKTGNKKTLTDVKDIAKTTFTNRLNPNDRISVEKTSNNNVHLLDYNGELLEFIPFINHNYDDEFYETLSYYYESKVKQKSPDDKEDPNQKIVEKLEQEYDKYDFSKLDRDSDDFKDALSRIVNKDSLEFKSIVKGEIVNTRSARKNIKQGDPIITIFDLYRTGLITGKDVDDIKKQLDKFVVLFEEPVQQKIERADIADKKKLLEEQVLKFSKKTRVNYFYTKGNYIAFVEFPNDANVDGKNFIETTDSGSIEWEFISYDKLDTFLDTNAHDTSKKYYFDLNDLLNNEGFLYKLFKYKYNYLSLDTSYDLFNKHVAEIIFNILDDNIKSKLATRLVDEVLTTVDTMSLDSVKAIMVGQRIKDTDDYQVWFYTKRKDGQKISFFNEISNINKNGRIKVKIDESREVILSNGRDDLIAKVLSGELRLSINNNIKSTRLNSLQINYAIQRHSSLDIGTTTNYRKFNGEPSSIRLVFEDVRKNGRPIGWKLYYKEDSYIELIQNEGRRFKAIEFRLKTKKWRQYTSYKQGDIFPFDWDEFDNFFKEVYDNLPDTFTIKQLYQALFYGIDRDTDFSLLLGKLKVHSDIKDDRELFKMLLIDAAQYMIGIDYNVSLNGIKMIDYEALTLSQQILDEIDGYNNINDMIDNIKFVKGTPPGEIISVNNTNTVNEGEDFDESEYQKAYGQKEELVLAETAVAHSHRLRSEYTYNEFPESFNQIDGEVTLIANYNKDAVAERNESTRKILTQYSDIKSGMVMIDSTGLSGLRLTYNGVVYYINSKDDYINLLEEIFDANKNNERFLKSERLLDILYMYDINVDKRGNITGIKSKSDIIAHSNKDSRNSAISQYWNGLNSGEKDNALLLLKKLFVISRMQLAINYKNTNDKYEYLGYMHDLPYLLDPYRSISLFNETIFRKPNEQLEAELSYVMNSFNKKIEIFNLLTDINQSVPVSFDFDNYGKLNTLNNTREVLAITLLKDTYQKYYISKQNINDLYNFVLFNLADSSKNIEELYTLKKIDFFNYMYLIILPIINKLNTNNTQTNEEYFWNTFVKPKVKDINEKNFATKSGKINYIALLQSIYETPNVLSNANRKTIEHEVLSKLISTDEDNNNYKRALLNYTVIELFNPFSNKSRFYTASNITLENGTKDIFNSDTVKDSTLLDQLSAKLQVKNQVLNNVLEGAKNIILSYINNTVSNNIFNNNVLTSDDDKLTHLRNIFKTIRLRLDSNKFDDDEQILLQLSNYKGNIGSLFIVSNKKGDEERDKLVIAYKDKNTYELIIIDKNAIVHKVYDMTEKSAKSGDISKIFNKKSEIALTRTDDKITSLLKKVYLVVDGSLPEIKSNAKINDSLSSTPITKYHEYVDYIFDTNINGIEGHYFIHPVIAIEDNVPTESDITTITSPSVDNDAIVNQQGISTIYEQLPNDLKAKAMAIFNPDSADSRLYSNSDYNKLLTELYDEFIKYQSSNNMLERQNIAVNILDIIIDINELNNDLNRC